MDGQLSWKLGSLLPILSVRVRNEARFIFRTHHPGVTCEPHCHLELSARSVWTDTHFYMYGNCSFYAQNTASERLDFSRPGFQAPRISAVLCYRPNTSVPVYLALMYCVLCLNAHTCICFISSRVLQKFCCFYIFEDWSQVLLTTSMKLGTCVPGRRDALGRTSVSCWVVRLNSVTIGVLWRALWEDDMTVLCSVPWSL